MKEFTHEQLHDKIDNNPKLKIKSDGVHSLPRPTSLEEAELLKLKMMEIYAEAIGCQQCENAQKLVTEIYSFFKNNTIFHNLFYLNLYFYIKIK